MPWPLLNPKLQSKPSQGQQQHQGKPPPHLHGAVRPRLGQEQPVHRIHVQHQPPLQRHLLDHLVQRWGLRGQSSSKTTGHNLEGRQAAQPRAWASSSNVKEAFTCWQLQLQPWPTLGRDAEIRPLRREGCAAAGTQSGAGTWCPDAGAGAGAAAGAAAPKRAPCPSTGAAGAAAAAAAGCAPASSREGGPAAPAGSWTAAPAAPAAAGGNSALGLSSWARRWGEASRPARQASSFMAPGACSPGPRSVGNCCQCAALCGGPLDQKSWRWARAGNPRRGVLGRVPSALQSKALLLLLRMQPQGCIAGLGNRPTES